MCERWGLNRALNKCIFNLYYDTIEESSYE